jgi:putative ABC transport system ATP-binding protein
MGVGHRAATRPAEMSGGEQQRAAIAVAVANQPKIILADEPTGELDTTTGAEVFGALRRANRELGVTTVIVTHDQDVAGNVDVHALRDVSFTVPEGELLAVKGRSGSGKTTLLNLIGGLDAPESGRVVVGEHEVSTLGEAGLQRMRRETVGFVFQSFGLIPVLSAAENVGVALRLTRTPAREREERVRLLLAMVGLADQTPASARTSCPAGSSSTWPSRGRWRNRSRALIADEPTGQLDSETAQSIMPLIRAVVRDQGVTAVVATHDPLIMRHADRVIELSDGELASGVAGTRNE